MIYGVLHYYKKLKWNNKKNFKLNEVMKEQEE